MIIKEKKNRDDSYRVGNRIRAKKVRVIDPDGNNLGILFLKEALERASSFSLDLVEVNKGEIPTCKILDYGKMKYDESKKDKKKKEKKTHEIQFRPKIAEHDLLVKVKNARRFLEKGANVHLVVQFKGRESTHPETGKSILDKVCSELVDITCSVNPPSMYGKKMDMMLYPKTN